MPEGVDGLCALDAFFSTILRRIRKRVHQIRFNGEHSSVPALMIDPFVAGSAEDPGREAGFILIEEARFAPDGDEDILYDILCSRPAFAAVDEPGDQTRGVMLCQL